MTTCTLPCHRWNDQIVDGKRIVEEENSGLIYGHGDSDTVIVQKLVALGVATIPIIMPVRMTTRLIFLATGMWISSGYERTQAVWNKICFDWYTKDRINPAPSSFQYYGLLVQNIGSELIDQIIKCAFLPLAAVALTFAAFEGLINPLDGRKLYSDIERIWSISLPEWMTDHSTMRFCNYAASCMQPKSTMKEQNLFRFYHHPNPILGLLHALKQLEKGGFIVLGDELKTWKAAVKKDVDDNGELQNLVDACNELNTLIASHAAQGTIDACEGRKQASIAALMLLLKP